MSSVSEECVKEIENERLDAHVTKNGRLPMQTNK